MLSRVKRALSSSPPRGSSSGGGGVGASGGAGEISSRLARNSSPPSSSSSDTNTDGDESAAARFQLQADAGALSKWRTYGKFNVLPPHVLFFTFSSMNLLLAAAGKKSTSTTTSVNNLDTARQSARKLMRDTADALKKSGRRFCVFDFGYDDVVRAAAPETSRRSDESGVLHKRYFSEKVVKLSREDAPGSSIPTSSTLFKECLTVATWITEQSEALLQSNGGAPNLKGESRSLSALAVIVTDTREHLACLLACLCSPCMVSRNVQSVSLASNREAALRSLTKLHGRVLQNGKGRGMIASFFNIGSKSSAPKRIMASHRTAVAAVSDMLFHWTKRRRDHSAQLFESLLPKFPARTRKNKASEASSVQSSAASATREWQWRSVALRGVALTNAPVFNSDHSGCRPYFMVTSNDRGGEVLYSSMVRGLRAHTRSSGPAIFELDLSVRGDITFKFYHVNPGRPGRRMFSFTVHTSALELNVAKASREWAPLTPTTQQLEITENLCVLHVSRDNIDMIIDSDPRFDALFEVQLLFGVRPRSGDDARCVMAAKSSSISAPVSSILQRVNLANLASLHSSTDADWFQNSRTETYLPPLRMCCQRPSCGFVGFYEDFCRSASDLQTGMPAMPALYACPCCKETFSAISAMQSFVMQKVKSGRDNPGEEVGASQPDPEEATREAPPRSEERHATSTTGLENSEALLQEYESRMQEMFSNIPTEKIREVLTHVLECSGTRSAFDRYLEIAIVDVLMPLNDQSRDEDAPTALSSGPSTNADGEAGGEGSDQDDTEQLRVGDAVSTPYGEGYITRVVYGETGAPSQMDVAFSWGASASFRDLSFLGESLRNSRQESSDSLTQYDELLALQMQAAFDGTFLDDDGEDTAGDGEAQEGEEEGGAESGEGADESMAPSIASTPPAPPLPSQRAPGTASSGSPGAYTPRMITNQSRALEALQHYYAARSMLQDPGVAAGGRRQTLVYQNEIPGLAAFVNEHGQYTFGVRPNASRSEISALPVHKYAPSPGGVQQEGSAKKCMICQYDYEEGDELRILPCIHQFHRECIDQWLYGSKRTCPICQTEI